MRSEQDIRHLCRKFTDLNDDDIQVLLQKSRQLELISEAEQLDVFINCMCKNKKETVTVAFTHCENSVYNISTLGYIIREEDEPAVHRTMRCGMVSKDIKAISYVTTAGNMIIQHAEPIFNGEKVVGAIIRERRFCPELLEEKEAKGSWLPADCETYPYLKNLTILSECVCEGVIVLNQEKKVVYRNPQAAKIYVDYGYIYDIMGKSYEEISMHGRLDVGPGIQKARQEGEFTCIGNHYKLKQFCYLDQEYFYILVISDITQEKRNEENLVLKSVAIREAHHRIKNNLQTIQSLLEMQCRRIQSKEGVMALQDAMTRIMSISTSYESLLIRGMDRVSLYDVIVGIQNKFMALIEDSPLEIEISVNGDDFDIDADTSTNIALVINELIQNSFKHAFVGREGGHIDITITERPVYSEIQVSDNGSGFDTSVVHNPQDSLGLQIAENIIKNKLKGRLDIRSNESGTTMLFDFRVYKK